MNPLDGARLKVVRAQEHMDSLKAEIRMCLDEQLPGIIRSQPYGELQRLTPPAAVNIYTPLRLSTIIGDCVNNARAALDYIVWDLAQKFFVPPFIDSEDRHIISFPIDGVDNRFSKKFNRLAKRGIPAMDQIKMSQTHGRRDDTLRWLHYLVNKDKHRMPLLTIGELDSMTVTLVHRLPMYSDSMSSPATFTVGRDFIANVFPVHSNGQMKAQTTICVTWEDLTMPREPVDRTLEQIIKTVADIIPRFDPFFL